MEQKRRTILIVDDVELNRAILNEMFHQNYSILEACNGKEALDIIAKENVDIVLLDIVMPVLDGFGVLESLHQQCLIERLPVIMITADTSENVMKKGYNMGVVDIINKPFNPDIVRRRVKNVLSLYSRQENLEELVEQQTKALQNQTAKLIDALSSIIEFKNMESGQHIFKIRILTKFLLQRFVKKYPRYIISPKQIDVISEAAAMHDIGKIAIPDDILNKPSRLTAKEFEIMKSHTIKGCEVANKLKYIRNKEFMGYCLDICRHHHERWDGKGYPDGLKGDDISIWSQVVSLADVYDALTSERVYKPAFSHKKSLDMIANGKCGAFNPVLISCFLENAEYMLKFLNDMTRNDSEYLDYDTNFESRESIVEDRISDRTLQLLELEREKFRIISELSGDIIFDYNVSKDILVFSERFYETFGKETVIKRAFSWIKNSEFVFDDDKSKLFFEFNNSSYKNKMYKTQIRLKTPKGNYEWYEIYIYFIWDIEKYECTTLMGKMTNIDNRYRELEQWKKFANTDPLTGIYNRKGVEEEITRILAIETHQQAALCYIDLDNFKVANDTFGHSYGDKLLIQIANQLKENIRSSDIIGRIGGDEFVVLLRGINSMKDISDKAERLCKTIGKGFCGMDYTISMGIAIFPKSAKSYEHLLYKADKALYCSKNSGKNQYTISK